MTQVKDPTAGAEGLQIKTVKSDEYRDVFDFVLQIWLTERAEAQDAAGVPQPAIAIPLEEQEDVKNVLAYVARARQLFTANQVVGQDFMTPTPALRFQDGSVLVFCDSPNVGMSGVGGSLDISKHHPNREGKGQTVNQQSWGVTGNQ